MNKNAPGLWTRGVSASVRGCLRRIVAAVVVWRRGGDQAALR